MCVKAGVFIYCSDKEFFDRPALVVAKDLIGKYLVRKIGSKEIALMIIETEAYFGFKDQGSHSHRGQTPRNTPMFMQAGTIYVYFTYGMHWMLNLVCHKEGFPAAVLIRGLSFAKTLHSGEINRTPPRRVFATQMQLNGPAKLTKFLKIDKNLNAKPLGKKSGLWIEDRGVKVPQIKKTPRIGIPNRGAWTLKPWRFVIQPPPRRAGG
jgi:DNA-3-methyladenine glycosylase